MKKKTKGLSALGALGDKLADKFATAVEQLGSDGEDIDTNRLRQLVGVMKDLTTLSQNSENQEDAPEKVQERFLEVIKNAFETVEDNNLAQDDEQEDCAENDKAVKRLAD